MRKLEGDANSLPNPGDPLGPGVTNILDLSSIKAVLFQLVTDNNNLTRDVRTDGLLKILDLSVAKGNLFKAVSCP